MINYIAHKDEEREQPLKEHLENVANLASEFAKPFANSNLAYNIGKLHDIGKYSESFQRRIRGSKECADHSTAGAVLAKYIYENQYQDMFSLIMGYCIAGHHSGLPDCGTDGDYKESPNLKGRLKKDIDNYDGYKNEITFNNDIDIACVKSLFNNFSIEFDFTMSFLIRMLYSCLVDADYLDTELFYNQKIDRKANYDFEEMYLNLLNHFEQFKNKKSFINEKRKEILDLCIANGKGEKGLYSLTVPTGGGKTLSSMAFALNQILTHKMDRIIYVIPYCSIIEQTANIFKGIFGENNVLEHHYNYEYDYDENFILSPLQQKLKLASQNWDMPIIVTTNVQFFESLYSNKSSRCRKLHNIANSVIIFDEVQMFPYDYLIPCLTAIQELINNYGASVLFCSATQPDFSSHIKSIKVKEIIKNPIELNTDFKRVDVNNIGNLSNDELIDIIKNEKQILTIVNSRKMALDLYKNLCDNNAFCLTTLLAPEDRKKNIEQIKEKLANGEECRVISTQLIEAGVDIDFPIVYRAVAGIDSIVQSAGRCNREGKLSKGIVNVFIPEEKLNTKNGHLTRGIQLGTMIMNKYDNIIALDAINEYFNHAYQVSNLDSKDIMGYFVKSKGKMLLDYDFKTANEKFSLIENNQKAVIIETLDNKKIIESLKYADSPSLYLKKLQKNTVMVYEYEFIKLYNDSKLNEILEGIFVLEDNDIYSDKLGLDIYYGNENLEKLIYI